MIPMTDKPARRNRAFMLTVALVAAFGLGAGGTYLLVGSSDDASTGAAEPMPDVRLTLVENCFEQGIEETWCLSVADTTASAFEIYLSEGYCTASDADRYVFRHLEFVVAIDDLIEPVDITDLTPEEQEDLNALRLEDPDAFLDLWRGEKDAEKEAAYEELVREYNAALSELCVDQS
jgi:hypothetical protein